jgi:tape measure domain-containing protein
MATLGTLTLKLRATRNLLALDLLQSQQEIERFEQSANKLLNLKTGVSIDWDSLSKAESELRRWVDSLPQPNLTVRAKLENTGLQDSLQDLERLLNNPLKIQVDDKRLFELNEHFKLKERDYQHLQTVLNTPLTIKVDRTQLDNLSHALQSIESTPQVNLRANVDLHSLTKFHEQLARYSQSRTVELATSVSRTTLNSLQKDLKDLSSSLTTARVSVQIDSQLQALRRELVGLPDTRVQVGVDVDDRRLRDLEVLLDRVSKPHKLRLDLPDTLGGIGSEIKKLVFSPITLPVKLAQNAIGGTFTGVFEGIGRELSRNFSKGFSSSIDGFVQRKTGSSLTEMGEKSGKYVAKNTYLWGDYAARSQGYEKGLRGVGEDVMKVGESIDSFANPRKFRRNVRKVEDTYVAYQEKINQGDTQGADEIRAAALKSLVEPAQNIMRRVAGVGLRGAAQPYRIRKRVRLAQSIEEANEQAKSLEIPHYDRAQADASESINLVMGGIDFNGTRNTAFASRLMRQVMPKGYTVPLTTPFSNTPVGKGGLVGDTIHGDGAMGGILKQFLGEDGMKGLDKFPLAKLMQIAVDKGYNPDAVRGYAHVKKIREMHPDKPINVMGTSGGSAVAEEIISMAERDGDKNVRGLGIGLPFHGLTGTAGKQFKGTVGDLDGNVFLAQYGSQYTQRKLTPQQLAQLPVNLGGILAPNRAQTAIIPNAGIDHNIGIFSTDKGFQNAASKQLGTFINPDFGQGKEGKINGKGVANLNPYVQFGNEDLTIPRTLKAMYGDRQAKKDIVVGGEYGFYHPAHPDWRRDSDFDSMKAGVKSKFDKASLNGLPKEHADEYMGFLDTMQSDLTAFYESKGKIKPSKSLEQAAKYYPELRDFATQKGVGNGKFEDAFQYREQPQKAQKPTQSTPPTPVEVATYNPFAGTAEEIKRRRQERENQGLNSFINAANPWSNDHKTETFDPSKHTPLRLDSKPKQDVADRSLAQAIARFDGAVTRFEQSVNKPGAKHSKHDVVDGEYVEVGAAPVLNAGRGLLAEASKPIGAGYSVLKAVEKTVLDLAPGGHTAKGIIQRGVVPLALGGIAMQSPVLGGAIHAAGNATHLLAQAPIDMMAGMAGDGIQGLLSGVSRLPGGAGLVADIAGKVQGLLSSSGAMATGAIGSVALPWLSGRLGMGLAGKATNALLPHLNDEHPALSAGTERLALTAGAAVKKFIPQTTLEPHYETPALPPSKLDTTKDGVNYINQSLEKTKGQIELAIKNGEIALAKKYTQKLEKDIAESSRLINSIASNPSTDTQSAQQLSSTVAGHLKQKSNFVDNAYQAIDLMEDGATLSDVKQQPGWSQKLKNIVIKGIRQNMGNNEVGSGRIEANPIALPVIAFAKFAQSKLGQTRIPGLDFLDNPLKSFKETIGLSHRESAYTQGTILGGDGTTRYTPPPTRFQSLITNARDSVDRFTAPVKQYIQDYPTNAKANLNGFIAPVKQYIQNYPANAKANFQSIVSPVKQYIQDYPDNAKANYQSLVTAIQDFRENPLQTIRAGMILGEAAIRRRFKPSQPPTPNTPDEQPPEQPPSLVERIKAKASRIFTTTRDTYDNAVTTVKSGLDRIRAGGASNDELTPLGERIDGILPKLGNLKDMGAKVLSVFAGFAGIAFVSKMLTSWGSAAFETASKMQSLEMTMGAVSSSNVKAQSSITRSKTESDNLGYNVIAGLEGDAAFNAAMKDSALETAAPDIMSGLKQYNRSRGVTEEKAKLAQVAVVQMAGKDIRAEEVFGQLEEASPGAAGVLARSMGMNVNQLRKEMQSGALNSNDALPRFGNQLAAEGMSGTSDISNSAAVSVAKLQNSFIGLQASVGGKLMAPTIEGLKAATAASNLLKDNIDTLGKVFAASLLSAAASAVGLSGGLNLASPVLGFLVKNLTLAIPLLRTFALQTALAYAAIEVFSTVMNSVNDSSPFKSLADESEAAFAKISKGASQTKQDIEDLKNEIYGKDRSVFQVVGDAVSGTFGGQTSITKKAADDTVNADRILEGNEKALKRKPPELTEANRSRRSEIDLELSVIRSQNANLTSKDRDKIDGNQKREQKLIEERSNLEKPINTRQAELQQVIKNANNIVDSPLRNDTEKALAKTQLAEAEKEQRKLQEQLISSASTLSVGLRKVGEGLQAGLAAIDLSSINRKTQTYLVATQDARNTGGLAQANYLNTNTDLIAKQSLQQQAVSSLKSTIYSGENRSTIQALGVDPENASQDQIDRLKSTVTDTRGQSLLGYLSKYQAVKTELAQTNQSLFENQYSYIKSMADYNKGSIDQVISLSNRLVNLSLTARGAIATLQQQVEQALVEIDSTSSKAVFQAQRNKIQAAYNKFLAKLGISTDDIFEQMFTNYNSIIDTVQQLVERRLGRKSSAITANYRESGNETRKYQTQVEQTQEINELKRQEAERRQANPNNQLGSGANQPVNNNSSNTNTSSAAGEKLAAQAEQTLGLFKDIPVQCANSVREVAKQAGVSLAVTDKPADANVVGNYTNPARANSFGGKNDRVITNKEDLRRGDVVQWRDTYAGINGVKNDGEITHVGVYLGDNKYWHHSKKDGSRINDAQGLKFARGLRVGGAEQVQAQAAPVQATVNSSTYTPGGGGMNGAEKDSRGNRLTRNDYAIAIPGQNRVKDQIPYGSVVKLNYGGKTVNAKVTDGGPYVPGRQMDMTTAAAKALGFDGVGQVGVSLQSLPKGADPNKKYYFGEATYKPRFGKGGSVSNAEAKKAIASVVRGDKYLTLGNGVQAESNPATEPQSSNSQPVGKGLLGEAILNNVYQQGVDQKIGKNAKLSKDYVSNVNRLSDRDTELTKQKLGQETNLSNQQDEADRTKLDTQILQNRNQINRNLPTFNRKSTELENQAAAYNRSSNNRDPYQKIDRIYQQYGGIPETATQDTTITDSQSAIEKLKEESRVRRENLLKQIQSIEAQGAGWANLKKTVVGQIQALKRNGFTDDATRLEDFVQSNDKAIGTPKARQQTIDRLSKQYRALPSDGIAVADAISPGVNKVLTDNRNLAAQYAPKNFGDDLQAEARSIIEKFKTAKESLQSEFTKLDEAVSILEAEIQAKLKQAGYGTQKLDLTDPKRLELLQKVAPEETAVLEQKTAQRLQLNLSGQSLDLNAATSAARSVSIGQQREQLNVSKANTDYLATTQDGNLFSQIQIDKQRYTQGKTELDLQFDQGAISADLYTAKLKQLGLETNTLRNSIAPLRTATTGFFSDIFAGQGVFDGLGTALKNLTINILKNFQDMISKHLGQQLFSSLSAGAGDLQTTAASGGQDFFSRAYRQISGGLGFSGTSNQPANPDGAGTTPTSGFEGYQSYGMNVGLNSSIFEQLLTPKVEPIPTNPLNNLLSGLSGKSSGNSSLVSGLVGLLGGGSGSSVGNLSGLLTGDLFSIGIPGFATGGVVSSPTVALVGEGISNEAIVPLPNGRSIPVDLSGLDQSSGGGGGVNSSVSVTIQNSGQAKETSKGEGVAISHMIKGAVMDVLINERRTGGLLA